MKLPQINLSLPKVPAKVHIAIGAAMVALLLGTAIMTWADYPWNGNPFKWLQAKELTVQGNQERSRRFQLEAALRYFQQAVNTYPKDPIFQFMLGETYQRLRKYPEAEKAFKESVHLNSAYTQAWLHLGEVLSTENHSNEAIIATKTAVAAEPLLAEAQAQLALLALLNGKQEEADKIISAARKLESQNGRYWYLTGRYYHALNKPQETEAAFRQATALDQTEPEYAEWLGICILARGKANDSVEWLEKATRIDANNASYWDNLGNAGLAQNDLAEAENCYQKALSIDSSNLKYKQLYALTLFHNKKYNLAEPILANLLALSKNDTGIRDYYIHCLLAEKKYNQCEEQLQKFLQEGNNKENPLVWTLLADILRQAKLSDKAMEAYKQALALKPDARLKQYLDKRLTQSESEPASGHNPNDHNSSPQN